MNPAESRSPWDIVSHLLEMAEAEVDRPGDNDQRFRALLRIREYARIELGGKAIYEMFESAERSLILNRIERLEKQMAPLSQGYSDLQKAIAQLSAEEGSVVSAIQQLQQQVAQGQPITGDQLEALVSQVNGVTSGLQAAITPPAPASSASAPGTSAQGS